MLKNQCKSLIMSPLDNEQMREHITTLIERNQEFMREKLQKQLMKEAKVEAVEKVFIQWADTKEQQIKEKLERNQKNKEDQLNKIVKKCKDHEKYLEEKRKHFHSKKRASLREAWKKSVEYQHDIEDYNLSRHISHDKSVPKLSTKEEMTESHYVSKKYTPLNRIEPNQEYLNTTQTNPSKLYGNLSKDYLAELNQSIRQYKGWDPVQTEAIEQKFEDKARKTVGAKLQQTFARFREVIEADEKMKIQLLGQRLQRIQKSRIKKIQSLKKKKQKNVNALEDSQVVQREKKKKVDRSQRVHSQSIIREKRVRDWSSINRQKREQFMQNQLQSGTEYLQSQKIKFLKTSLAKKIAVSAIEKKLFIERLNH